MASLTYSAEELLCVRKKALREDINRKLFARLKRDSGLGDMIRAQLPTPSQERSVDVHASRCEDNCRSKSLSRQLDGTEGEWRYCGRTDSEHIEGQPIPAPPGMVAQKDKGFQRFYKAVVSPSHVRVTAGGRIVPNTRGSVSPGPKWPADRPSSDAPTERSASGLNASQSYGFPVAPTGFAPMAPMFPGFGPALMPAMPGGASPFQMMPWHPGIGFGTGFPVMSNSSSMSQPPLSSPQHGEGPCIDKQSDSGSIKAASLQGPSPDRSQFHTGMHWMMPPVSPFYPMPYQQPASYGYSQQPTFAASKTHQSGVDMHSKTKDLHSTRSAPAPSALAGVAIGQTPVSSIRPSEITKNQIGVLRSSLKYLEDQLLYNKHQVDEKAIEHQVDMVKQQIRHFEKNLENQLTFESNHYPKAPSLKMQARSESSRRHPGSKTSVASEDSVDRGPYKLANASSTSLAHSERSKSGSDKKTSFSAGINSTKSVSAFAPMRVGMRATLQSESRGPSAGLPVTAALAPPFEPQARKSGHSLQLEARSESQTWSEREQNGSVCSRGRKQDSDDQSRTNHAPMQSKFNDTLPYLIGYLPYGVNPGTARDTDYAYTRALSEDELRARHMYWGKTPRHLQKGLPKFDGKDFYPPSPVKGRSSDRESTSSFASRRLPVGNAAVDYGLGKTTAEAELFRSLEHAAPRATRGPFGIMTQSEALARSSRGTDNTSASARYERAGSCTTRVGGQISSEDGAEANEEDSTASLPDKSSSDELEEEKDLLFKGRRTSRTISAKAHNNEIWRSMLKKGKTSSNVVPGAVSSTTVQGVLPQYAGYASASLTPAIANSTIPAPRLALGKAFDAAEGANAPAVGDRKRENLPPVGPEGAGHHTERTSSSFVAS